MINTGDLKKHTTTRYYVPKEYSDLSSYFQKVDITHQMILKCLESTAEHLNAIKKKMEDMEEKLNEHIQKNDL